MKYLGLPTSGLFSFFKIPKSLLFSGFADGDDLDGFSEQRTDSFKQKPPAFAYLVKPAASISFFDYLASAGQSSSIPKRCGHGQWTSKLRFFIGQKAD